MALLSTAANAGDGGRRRNCGYFWRHFFQILGALLIILSASSGILQAQGGSEYQIKAAYLYNFAKFVEWPSAAFSEPSDPFRICILGDSPFDPDIERALSGRRIQNHVVRVIYPDNTPQCRKCHVLYLSPSESGHMKAIVAELHSSAVLTVGDTPGFINAGGMIRFFVEEDSVRFEINSSPAAQAGLKVSSKLQVLGKKRR